MKKKFIMIFLWTSSFLASNIHYHIIKIEESESQKNKEKNKIAGKIVGSAIDSSIQLIKQSSHALIYVTLVKNVTHEMLSLLGLTKFPGSEFIVVKVEESQTSSVGEGDIILIAKNNLELVAEITKINGKLRENKKDLFVIEKQSIVAIHHSKKTEEYKFIKRILCGGITLCSILYFHEYYFKKFDYMGILCTSLVGSISISEFFDTY